MRVEVRSIAIWPFVRTAFLINVVVAFVIGVFYALFLAAFLPLLQGLSIDGEMPIPDVAPIAGVMLIFIPFLLAIFGGIFYTLGELIVVAIYNLFARLAGGFEFELVEKPEQPSWQPPVSAVSAAQPSPPPPPPYRPGEPPQTPPPPTASDYNI